MDGIKQNTKTLVDFGAGLAKTPGHIGIDVIQGSDIVLNLDDPLLKLPFKDESIDGARSHHFIEHIINIIPFMNEVYRCLKVGAVIELSTPNAFSSQFWQDPTHKKGFVPESFLYFRKDSPFEKEQKEYGITARFEVVRCEVSDGWQLEVTLKK